MSLQLFPNEVSLDPWQANGALQRLQIKEEYIRWALRTLLTNVSIYMLLEGKNAELLVDLYLNAKFHLKILQYPS